MVFVGNLFFRNPPTQGHGPTPPEAVGTVPLFPDFNGSSPFFRSVFLGSLGGASSIAAQRTIYGVRDALYGQSPPARFTTSDERVFSERSASMRFVRFNMVVTAPLVEEVIFRGVFRNLQIRGHQYFLGENENSTVSVVARTGINAGLFTLAHARSSSPRYLAAVFASGCIFNGLAETTHGIFASTMAHSLYNLHALRNRVPIR